MKGGTSNFIGLCMLRVIPLTLKCIIVPI